MTALRPVPCDDCAAADGSAKPAASVPQRSATPVQRRRYDAPAWRGVAHQHGELLRAVLSEHPGARQAWADRLGISRQALDDLIESERLYEGDVALLPAESFLAYLAALRDLHTASAASTTTRLQAVTDAHRECSEAVTIALQGTARGSSVSREEQRREIREARAALDRLDAVVEASP